MTIVIAEEAMASKTKTKTMAAGKFKATCLALMDEVEEKGFEIIVTKRGKPIAKLIPFAPAKKDSIFGFMEGKGKITGDIVKPVLTLEEWGNLA
jgi:prevent-host-death family protein